MELSNVKHVLKFSPSTKSPFKYIPEGQAVYLREKCGIKNCYITSNKSLLGSITAFDVVLFNGSDLIFQRPSDCLPSERSPNQSYIFTNTEFSDNYYVPDARYNIVFNFTWTYKLSSYIYYGFISIRNRNDEVIDPSVNISWRNVDNMLPIDEITKENLKHKKFAAAWFVSNCHARNKRGKLALKINDELKKYNMSVDIYGDCLYNQYPRNMMNKCFQMLQRDYYFYFAFENSMSDDYVTEKLLNALNNYAVPIVYGGADYNR